MLRSLSCLALGALIASPAFAAPVVAFDGAFRNGFAAFGGATIDSSGPVYPGNTAALKVAPTGAWGQIGIGGGPAIPADASTFSFMFYVQDLNSSNDASIQSFKVQGDGSVGWTQKDFDSTASSLWTVDGNPGNSSFTVNTWHAVSLDIGGMYASVPGFALGSTALIHTAVFNNNDPSVRTLTFYLDSAGYTAVPEPTVAAIMGIASLSLLRRRNQTRSR